MKTKDKDVDELFGGLHLKYLQRAKFSRGSQRFSRNQGRYIERFYFCSVQPEGDEGAFELYVAVEFNNLFDEYYPMTTWGELQSDYFRHNHWVTRARDLLADEVDPCGLFNLIAGVDHDIVQQEMADCIALASTKILANINSIRDQCAHFYHNKPR